MWEYTYISLILQKINTRIEDITDAEEKAKCKALQDNANVSNAGVCTEFSLLNVFVCICVCVFCCSRPSFSCQVMADTQCFQRCYFDAILCFCLLAFCTHLFFDFLYFLCFLLCFVFCFVCYA